MTGPFTQLHHISILVHDIEDAVARYEALGIGPWHEYPAMSDLTEVRVPNPEAFARMKYRYADLDNVQIQLLEPPLEDCPQRRYLDERGEGVWMLGFDGPVAAGTAAGEAAGLGILQLGRRANGTGWTYFDSMDAAGVVLMLRQATPLPEV